MGNRLIIAGNARDASQTAAAAAGEWTGTSENSSTFNRLPFLLGKRGNNIGGLLANRLLGRVWGRRSAARRQAQDLTAASRLNGGLRWGWEDRKMPSGELARSRNDRMIAGVCGGLAKWLGWDPTAVRIVYVLASVLSAAFPGTIVYIILALVMPVEDE